jgi:hypothetical protein
MPRVLLISLDMVRIFGILIDKGMLACYVKLLDAVYPNFGRRTIFIFHTIP